VKVFRIHGIEWFLTDDTLVPVVEALTVKEDTRRGYSVCEWQGRKIFIKSFSEKGIAGLIRNRVSSRGKREFELARRLLSCSIATPEPRGYGVSRQGSYIIEEWIKGENFLKVLQEREDRTDLLARLAGLLKRMKEHCLRHNDLHLENILLSDDTLYLIDLHTMQIKKGFSKEDEISNLSHALAMIYDDMDEGESDTFFRHYGVQHMKGPLEEEIQRLRERWVKSKKKRAFQGTSRIIADGEYLRVSGFEERGSGRLVAVIKDDTKVRVERMEDHIRKIYRKKRRLERAWKNHVMLLYMNITVTPQPYYLKRPSFSSAGFIAMEDLKGKGEELDQYLDRRYEAMTGRFFPGSFQKEDRSQGYEGLQHFCPWERRLSPPRRGGYRLW
jgi:tRNA A-37 threonylcarbamoyl transferase component Bud32